jgi:GNAT superfamily N-acetyltransferase
MGEITVRRATLEDAAEVARVQVATWHEAYTGRMPQSILDALDVQESRERWHRIMKAASDRSAPGGVWLAERDGSAVGFAAAGVSRDIPVGWHLYAIYLLAEHHGSGAGQALLDAAIGQDPASLWILEDNPRARAFYERNGFRADGRVQDDDQWGESVREVRMVRTRQEPASPHPVA